MGGVHFIPIAQIRPARFIMDCNQTSLPHHLFSRMLPDFMVGRDAEQSGIIRSGAKLVNAGQQFHCAQDHRRCPAGHLAAGN